MKRIFLSLVIAFYFAAGVSAQEYGFDVWTTANGLPQNTVTGVAQTPDGYLWLSTFDGLARFDGVRFTIFDKGNTKGIVNNRFSAIFVDRQGTIYATTDNHLITVYRGGVFTSYSQFADSNEPFAYLYLKSDADGNAIIETDTVEYYFDGGQFVPIPNQKVKGLKQIFFGKSGTKWIFEPHQISRIKNGQTTVYQITLTPPEMLSSLEIRPFEDSQGALWITRNLVRELVRLQDGAMTVFTAKEIPGWNGLSPALVKEESDGTLGFFFSVGYPAKPSQFVRFKDNQFTTYQFKEAIGSQVGLIDREGNFWLGTTSGLRRLRRQLITNLSAKDGLNSNEVYPLVEMPQGDIFIGSSKGLNRYENGKITDLGLVYTRVRFPILASGLASVFGSELWIGYDGGFGRYENGKLKILKDVEISATDFTADREGNVWVSTGGGLYKYKDGSEIAHYTTADGLPGINTVLTHQDRHGNLWAGTFDGIAVLKGDRFADFKQAPDSPKGYVRAIYEDADGTLWFGTYGDGLVRYKDGKFFNYRVEDGLFNNGVFAILEDSRGNLWMSSNRGIHRVNRQELNDFADGKTLKLNAVSYDEKDGMLNAECNGGRIPSAIKTKDGKFWFATMGGVAVVDPEAETINPNPPPVVIENVSVDRKSVDANLLQSATGKPDSAVELEPGQSNVEINYTGLSLVKSAQIKFKYRLEGLEENWVEAGTKRTANYSYLPHGEYTFHAIAANADGVWNMEGAAIKIIVRPYYYQTWWFRVLAALAVALIVWLVYHNRVSHLQEIARAKTVFSRQLIESQEAERKRLASELHDGLGQNLVVIKNRALLGINKGDDAERVKKELTNISESATQALEEVREITNNLRPQLLDRLGLTKAINAMLKKVSGVIEIESRIDSIDNIFDENEEISIYRIVQESLNNIIKHSNASDAIVTIKRDEDKVSILIEDNGKGFDVGGIKSDGGNLGIVGLKERAQLLKGDLVIDSKIGEGTKIRVVIKGKM